MSVSTTAYRGGQQRTARPSKKRRARLQGTRDVMLMETLPVALRALGHQNLPMRVMATPKSEGWDVGAHCGCQASCQGAQRPERVTAKALPERN